MVLRFARCFQLTQASTNALGTNLESCIWNTTPKCGHSYWRMLFQLETQRWEATETPRPPQQAAMQNSWARETPALWTAEHCCHLTVLCCLTPCTVSTATVVTAHRPSPTSSYWYHKIVIQNASLWHILLSSERINSPSSIILAKRCTTVTTMTLTALSVLQAFSECDRLTRTTWSVTIVH